MVVLHVKCGDDSSQFLLEASVSSSSSSSSSGESVGAVVARAARVSNLRHRIGRLVAEGRELAKYGVAKRPEMQGLDEEVEGMQGLSLSSGPKEPKGPFYTPDPTGRRTGEACDPNTANTLIKTLEEAEALVSKKQVEAGKVLTEEELQESVRLIGGAVTICYPAGLPEWDPVRAALDGNEDLTGTQSSLTELDEATATLWWAGKQMLRENKLSDYVGKNEKTKIVVKLQKKGSGAPVREPVADADTQKAMMAWYYKQQELQKKLETDDEDAYTNSVWANPKALKKHFSGVGTVKYR